MPVAGGPAAPIPHVDKILHFALFFLLVWLGGRYLLSPSPGNPTTTLGLWAAIYVGYAAADELLQAPVGRTASLADWLCDVAGILCATAILAAMHRRGPASPPPDLGP